MKPNVVLFFPMAVLFFSGCITATGSELSKVDACGSEPVAGERGEPIQGVGTVRWQEIEGGFWGIVLDDGSHIDPLNLCEELQEEGRRVAFEGWTRSDMASAHMWGTLVELGSVQVA